MNNTELKKSLIELKLKILQMEKICESDNVETQQNINNKPANFVRELRRSVG
jgi:DNA-directed RNA polymerase subunit H (RpoH/RPB5)